jgi:hypothetical protein
MLDVGKLLERGLLRRGGLAQRAAAQESSKMLGGASQIVSMIRVKCNGK